MKLAEAAAWYEERRAGEVAASRQRASGARIALVLKADPRDDDPMKQRGLATAWWSACALSVTTACFLACGDDAATSNDAAPRGDAGAEIDGASDPGVDGSSSIADGATNDGASVDWPPPARAACGAPTLEDGGVLAVADGGSVRGVALTWTGSEVGMVYDVEGAATHVVSLGRLDRAGHALAPASVLAPSSAGGEQTRPSVAIATDRSTHVACWQDDAHVRCASIPVAGGAVSSGGAGRELEAEEPSLAFDGISRVLYARGQPHLVAPDGTLTTPIGGFLPVDGYVTARSPGFAITTYFSMGNVPRVRWRELTSSGDLGVESEITGRSLGVRAAASSATGALALVTEKDLSGIFTLPLVAGGAPTSLDPSVPSNISVEAALVAAKDSYAAVWPGASTVLHYAALSTAGASLAPPVPVGGRPPLAFTAVDDGFLLVSTLNETSLLMTHIVCP